MISENIRNLRKNFNINQVELASKLGVTKQCVSNWENDNILPSIEMLIKLAKFFSVTTDYLLDLNSDKTIDVSGLTDIQIKKFEQDIKNGVKIDLENYYTDDDSFNTGEKRLGLKISLLGSKLIKKGINTTFDLVSKLVNN